MGAGHVWGWNQGWLQRAGNENCHSERAKSEGCPSTAGSEGCLVRAEGEGEGCPSRARSESCLARAEGEGCMERVEKEGCV